MPLYWFSNSHSPVQACDLDQTGSTGKTGSAKVDVCV